MASETTWFRFLCPSCQSELEAQPEQAGKIISCPECGNPMKVPEPPPPETGPGRKKVVIRSSPGAGSNSTTGLAAGPQPPFARPQPSQRDNMPVRFRF